MRPFSLRFFALCALLGTTFFTAACEKKDPAVNLDINGTLENGDLIVEDDGSWYDDHEFYTEVGWNIQVVMQSETVVPFVWLIGADGESLEQLTTDAGSRTVVMTTTAPYSGSYVVRANTLEGGETGAYHLTVVTTAPDQTPPAPPVEGSTVPGPPEGEEAPAAGSVAAPVAPVGEGSAPVEGSASTPSATAAEGSAATTPTAEASTQAAPTAQAGDGGQPNEASAAVGAP